MDYAKFFRESLTDPVRWWVQNQNIYLEYRAIKGQMTCAFLLNFITKPNNYFLQSRLTGKPDKEVP